MAHTRFVKYAHVFWIPLFPYGTEGGSVCGACEASFEPDNMDRIVGESYETFKAGTKVPIWTFSGLAVIALLIAGLSYSNHQDEVNTESYVSEPMAGDVVEYKTEDGNYSTMAIDSVFGDSLIVTFNDYQVDKLTGLSELHGSENYSDETYSVHGSLLTEMQAGGEIYKIVRD